jgi:hypothetical protein
MKNCRSFQTNFRRSEKSATTEVSEVEPRVAANSEAITEYFFRVLYKQLPSALSHGDSMSRLPQTTLEQRNERSVQLRPIIVSLRDTALLHYPSRIVGEPQRFVRLGFMGSAQS